MADDSLLKKAMLAGLGIYSLSKDKAQELANDLIKRGELSKDESAKFIKAMMDKADEELDYLKKFIDKRVQQTVSKVRPSYEKEFEELHRKIDKLTREVEQLRK